MSACCAKPTARLDVYKRQVQRHLKAVGIFARLKLRDGKPGYLGDIPRTLGYVLAVAERYPELAGLHDLLQARGVDHWEPVS